MKPLKRCLTKSGANVLLIDIEDDDDDVIVVDAPECSHPKKGESSEHRENRRVSPQSVIRIDDDDDGENESHTNHPSAHHEEAFTEFESDATSSHQSSCPHGIPRDSRPGCYRFGNDEYEYEYEPIEIDSDCEVVEDSIELRELWEKAAYQRNLNRHKPNLGSEDMETASGSNTDAAGKNNMTENVSEGPSCSKADPFNGAEIPTIFNVVNEENNVPYDKDNLFPEFDWMNLGGRSAFKNTVSSKFGEAFNENRGKMFDEFYSESIQSQNDVGIPSFGFDGKDQKEQLFGETQKKEETCLEKIVSESQFAHKQSSNQVQCSADNVRNGLCSHGEHFTTEPADCDCVFHSDCVCGRRGDVGGEKVHMEEQITSLTPCKDKTNNPEVGCNSTSGDAPNNSPVDMDSDGDHEKNVHNEKNDGLQKLSSSKTLVEAPLVASDTNHVPEVNASFVVGNVGFDIINDKEKHKETDEYKRAMEEEWASRKEQLKLQAEEAQRLRKRKKAESLRISNMEKRQKQRLEEVRASQKQDSANLDLKEQFRSEVIKELKVLETRCFDMASLLRSLGVQVEGGTHPSQQQMHGAYKRAVLKFHPDRTSGSSLKQQVEAEEKFKLISRMKAKYKLQ